MLSVVNSKQLKDHLRDGSYVFPGGYEEIYIRRDGGILCHDCILSEFCLVLDNSFYSKALPDWQVIAVESSSDSDPPLDCDHCHRNLSPYEED